MKNYFSFIAAFIICMLASCQKPFEENLSSTITHNSARLNAIASVDPDDMTEEQWIAQGYTESVDLSHLSGDVQHIFNNYFSQMSNIESMGDYLSDYEMLTLVTNAAMTAKKLSTDVAIG